MRRVQRGWCAAAVVGLWLCACSSDASYSSGGPIDTTGAGPPSTGSFAGRANVTQGSAGAIGVMSQICPEVFGSAGNPPIVINVGGSSAAGGTSGAGAESGAVPGAGESARGGVGGSEGTLVACPSEPPIAKEQQACVGPGVCPYIDGTTCSCQPCSAGWCWSCIVAQLPIGCPRIPPKDRQSCPWTGVVCSYGDCNQWDKTTAGCCLGQWRVAVTRCRIEL